MFQGLQSIDHVVTQNNKEIALNFVLPHLSKFFVSLQYTVSPVWVRMLEIRGIHSTYGRELFEEQPRALDVLRFCNVAVVFHSLLIYIHQRTFFLENFTVSCSCSSSID